MSKNAKGTPIVKGLGFDSFGLGANACTVDIDEEANKILLYQAVSFRRASNSRGIKRLENRSKGKNLRAGL